MEFAKPEFMEFNDFFSKMADLILGDNYTHTVMKQHKGCVIGFVLVGGVFRWEVKFSSDPKAKWYVWNDGGRRWGQLKSDVEGCYLLKFEDLPEECHEMALQWYNEILGICEMCIREKRNEREKKYRVFKDKVKNDWSKYERVDDV